MCPCLPYPPLSSLLSPSSQSILILILWVWHSHQQRRLQELFVSKHTSPPAYQEEAGMGKLYDAGAFMWIQNWEAHKIIFRLGRLQLAIGTFLLSSLFSVQRELEVQPCSVVPPPPVLQTDQLLGGGGRALINTEPFKKSHHLPKEMLLVGGKLYKKIWRLSHGIS